MTARERDPRGFCNPPQAGLAMGRRAPRGAGSLVLLALCVPRPLAGPPRAVLAVPRGLRSGARPLVSSAGQPGTCAEPARSKVVGAPVGGHSVPCFPGAGTWSHCLYAVSGDPVPSPPAAAPLRPQPPGPMPSAIYWRGGGWGGKWVRLF